MTLATVAVPNGNGLAVLFVMVILIGFIDIAMHWSQLRHSGKQDKKIARLDRRIEALAEWNGVVINDPVDDDSPEAMAMDEEEDEDYEPAPDDDTDRFPAIPATEPMALAVDPTPAVQARRDAAWDEQRHELMSPETAEKQRLARAAFVEQQLARFDFSGRSK